MVRMASLLYRARVHDTDRSVGGVCVCRGLSMCTHAEEKQQCCMPREERIESIASRVGHTNTRIFSLPAPSIRVCLFFRDISFSPLPQCDSRIARHIYVHVVSLSVHRNSMRFSGFSRPCETRVQFPAGENLSENLKQCRPSPSLETSSLR